ncbi:hypothetical protein B0O99DRAFT_693355 [Bisporella sp. PMI_857]|nr:hypothetical protein B0O99DRAFT_693355 [Bisporella sp. PMI_857]
MYSPTAVSLTWIDKLDDPTFPASYQIQPYTDDEIKEQQATAESEVDDLTEGLLEVTESRHHKENLFFCKSVQFFHQTLRDFVKQSKQLRDFSTEFPNLVGFEAKARVYLAELWFAKTEYVEGVSGISRLLGEYPCGPSRDAQLDAFERVVSYHIQVGCGHLRGFTTSPDSAAKSGTSESGTFMSFIHYVTWRLNDVEYVRRRVSRYPDLLLAKDDLSLIVSASLAWEDDSSMLKMLLDLGASPNEQVKVKGRKHETTASAWMIFCIYFAATMIREEADRFKDHLCGRLEQFLVTGVVDTNCVILVAPGREPQAYEGPPTHRISLRQLVQQLEPANGESLLKMMNGPRKGVLTSLRDAWGCLTTSKPDSPSLEAIYPPFDLRMQPPPPPPEDDTDDDFRKYMFFVHSVELGDTQVMVPHLKLRWY